MFFNHLFLIKFLFCPNGSLANDYYYHYYCYYYYYYYIIIIRIIIIIFLLFCRLLKTISVHLGNHSPFHFIHFVVEIMMQQYG